MIRNNLSDVFVHCWNDLYETFWPVIERLRKSFLNVTIFKEAAILYISLAGQKEMLLETLVVCFLSDFKYDGGF